MLEFYADESGTHGHSLLTVAGYVADVNKWADFSVEWRRVLDHYKVEFVHAKAFSNAQARIHRHLQRRDRRDLLSALVANIKKTVVAGVFGTIRPAEYKLLTSPRFRSDHGSAYSICVQVCIAALHLFLPAPGRDTETVRLFLEDGHRNALQALEMIKRAKEDRDPIDMRGWQEIEVEDSDHLPALMPSDNGNDPLRQKGLKIGAYGLGSKRTMPPLQAADLLAYCLHTEIATRSHDRFARTVMSDLLRDGLPHYGFHCSEDRITDLIEGIAEDEKKIAAEKRVASSAIRELKKFGFSAKLNALGLDIDFSNASEEGMKKYLPGILKEQNKS